MAVLTLDRWNLAIGDGQPLVVLAGLNVLEDEGLAMETARHLKSVCADLGLPYVFKASFDKANRSSIHSYRGPGLEVGLRILEKVKGEFGVPIVTDLHEIDQAEAVAAVAGRAAWITSVKRVDAPTRATMKIVHYDEKFGLVKVNPMATWTDDDVAYY